MRNVSLYMMMSYDGYLATADNGLEWMIPDPSMKGDNLLTSTWDTAILGYGGYKELSAYWPTAKENDPNISESDAIFADQMNSMKKLVFSGSKRELTWNNSEIVLISDDASIVDAVARIKEQPGKGVVVFGGVQIAQTFVRLDLIDHYLPVIHPIVIGSGRPLFKHGDQRFNLQLVDVKQNKAGAVRMHHRRVR